MSQRKIREIQAWLEETRDARRTAHELEEQIKEGFWN